MLSTYLFLFFEAMDDLEVCRFYQLLVNSRPICLFIIIELFLESFLLLISDSILRAALKSEIFGVEGLFLGCVWEPIIYILFTSFDFDLFLCLRSLLGRFPAINRRSFESLFVR